MRPERDANSHDEQSRQSINTRAETRNLKKEREILQILIPSGYVCSRREVGVGRRRRG